MSNKYQQQHDDLDMELYYSFIPFVVKSWFSRHNYSINLKDYLDDIVSELYLMYKTEDIFERLQLRWPEDIGMWYVIFFYRVPKAIKNAIPNFELLDELPYNQGQDDEHEALLFEEILNGDIFTSTEGNILSAAYLYYIKSYSRKDIAEKFEVSVSTVGRWLDQAKRILKKIFWEE